MIKKWVNSIDDVVATTALTALITISILNVLLRFIFNNPLTWGEEITLALYVWVVFIGASSAIKRNGHIGMDFLVTRLPDKAKNIAAIIRALVIYGVCLYVFVYLGYQLAIQAGAKVTSVLQLSYFWIDLAVPIGGILMMYQFTRVWRKSLEQNPMEKGDI